MAGRLVLITLTGGRDLAWQLCKKMVAAQTVKPDLWVIVDDCLPSLPMDIDFCPIAVIYPDKVWQPGQNSQARNMLAALEHVTQEDKILIIEDDDYYPCDYVEKTANALETAFLVGETDALYYNVGSRRWYNNNNKHHSSLCATGMKGAATEQFIKECQNNHKFIDLYLWRNFRGRKKLYKPSVIGMKGLPGRPGIGAGHDHKKGTPDPDLIKLKSLIGADFINYIDFKEN